MKPVILKFNTLGDLVAFLKSLPARGYVINTVHNTLSLRLYPFETDLAVEKYQAAEAAGLAACVA